VANKSPVNWLTELSGIGLGAVAVLYICGYLAHTVYYRLMGIDVGAQPFTYLTFSGDYLISIFISIPQLFSPLFLSYGPKIMENWRWLVILLCLLSLLCLLLGRKRSHAEGKPRKILACLFIGLACLTIILSELEVLRVQNVLQPFSPVATQDDWRADTDKKDRTLQRRMSLVKETYEEHEKLGTGKPGFAEWKRWFDPLTPNTEQERSDTYLALLFVNIVFFITLIVAVWLRGTGPYSKVIAVEALIGSLLALLLLPCVYATLGKVFSFPVVEMRIKTGGVSALDRQPEDKSGEKKESAGRKDNGTEAKELLTHPVFLISQDESEVVVYDRLNLFQVKRVPRSQVVGINQLGISSPFEDCLLEQGFAPCEALWAKDSAQIVDF
jgi:hypothetical protein